MSWTKLLLLSLLSAQPDQAEISLDSEVGTFAPGATALETSVPGITAPEITATEIVVYLTDLEDAWLELTHLASDASPVLVRLEAEKRSGAAYRFVPDLPPGPTMVCSGARNHAVSCEQVYRGVDELAALPEIEVGFTEGLEIRGALRQDLDPVARAQVALVPADLEAFRPYTMPLEVVGARAVREVESDADGLFVIPETAPGAYFLEVVLPSGRVHHTAPFDLPDRDALRRNYEVDDRLADELELFWDLGRIDVPSGLDVRFRVSGLEGEPIAGAVVAAIQGATPNDVANFVGATDREGLALLHGLDVERPVRVTCEKKGYEPIESEYELLPVEVDCILRRWARVFGEVIGPDSLAPRAATVTLRRAGETAEQSTAVAADGRFVLGEVVAGEYELRAAAPGFRVEESTFTVDYGQELDLGPILLLFAREVEGVVVDRDTGEPLAGVDIRATAPPGAVETFTDIDGEFRFGVDADEPLVLELSTVDYATREITLSPEELASRDPLVVELEPAGWIMVYVRQESGERCQGCRAVLWPGGDELLTDARGEALSGPLAPGVYRVALPSVTHLGSTVVEHPEAETHRARVWSGRLTVVEITPQGRTIRVRFRPELEGLWTLSARTRLRTEKTYAEADGRFSVRQKSGETLDLFLHSYDKALGREIAVWQSTLSGGLDLEEVSLSLSGSLVRGRLAGLDGPLAGAEVRLLNFVDADLRAVVYTYPDGSFQIPHVRPGIYNLYVGPRSVKFVSVRERQTLDLGTFELFLGR